MPHYFSKYLNQPRDYATNYAYGSTAFALSLAAGAIIAMLAETMMPEAYRLGGHHISFATAAGFLVAFIVAV